MTNYDLALPSNQKELPVYLESEIACVFEKFEKDTGDTLYLCCLYDRTIGRWDSRLETYNENKAEIWFNSISSEADMEEYEFDVTTLNSGVILDILNGYKGDNIWEDVIGQFEFEVTPILGVDAFIMEDEDSDILRFYYCEGDSQWTWRENDNFDEENI
jgi:hypothetical protein